MFFILDLIYPIIKNIIQFIIFYNNDSIIENTGKKRSLRIVTKKYDTIVINATGRAITTAVETCEALKRLISGLHQIIDLTTLEIQKIKFLN